MSRIPGFMLTHEVDIELLAGSTARGATFDDPITRPAHVEERQVLRLDERAQSETAGTLVAMSVMVVLQLDRTITAGARITWLGRLLTAANVTHLEHPHAPSNSELWCV